MVSKKKIVLIAIIALIVVVGVYLLVNYHQAETSFSGEHHILVLCTDPSENRPGVGAVDMAFVVTVTDGNVGNITPVYPGGLAHPTLTPTADMQAEGLNLWYLHDSLWSDDLENGTKIAQEIVEYHTGMTTDFVVIVTPTAIDALINAVGPVYSDGELVENVSSIDFLREDQSNNGATRGDAVEGLAQGIIESAQKNNNKADLIKAALEQYTAGNIQAVPADKFSQFVSYEGFNSLLG
ncbi:DUF4012 domain-containing protein [Methanosphaera sp. WGK6]|uniref:DUF4012 domain-containing protein n=1 Tax=Methanosphaera sp. WGK6 TaxID=1561964 RepID=UPI00084C4681|nr:DUF4012 domain-containing protein [Methanosphaera sp. WGK6]OED30271.1 hypothetical protein NL43_03845 [Methanosphaera sp. WGK6]